MSRKPMERQRDPTYMKISELCAEYHKSRTTVTNYMKEIDKEPRYKNAWIDLEPGASTRLINRNVFEDYLHYRSWLVDRNLRKHLKPFDPAEVRRQRGESNEGESNQIYRQS